jgi:hypothetical protein
MPPSKKKPASAKPAAATGKNLPPWLMKKGAPKPGTKPAAKKKSS